MSGQEPPHRRPLKSGFTQEDLDRARDERHAQHFERGRRRRQALMAENRRRITRQLEFRELNYYVIHGHAGTPETLVGRTFQTAIVDMVYYCGEGETTAETERRNPMASWPRLLNRLLEHGTTLPDEHVVQRIDASGANRPYTIFPGADVPRAGVYFVRRTASGLTPIEVQRLCEIPTGGVLIVTLLRQFILPHRRQLGIDFTLDVHWVACRAVLRVRVPTTSTSSISSSSSSSGAAAAAASPSTDSITRQ